MLLEFLAPFLSLFIWIICSAISLYCFIFLFYKRILTRKLIESTSNKLIVYLLLGVVILSPLLVGLSFRLGGFLLKGANVPWGARIENFETGVIVLWSFFLMKSSIVLILALIKPSFVGFDKRYKAFFLYIIYHLFTLYLFIIMEMIIPVISGPLGRLNSTSGGFD